MITNAGEKDTNQNYFVQRRRRRRNKKKESTAEQNSLVFWKHIITEITNRFMNFSYALHDLAYGLYSEQHIQVEYLPIIIKYINFHLTKNS
jgi:hypothetical protein